WRCTCWQVIEVLLIQDKTIHVEQLFDVVRVGREQVRFGLVESIWSEGIEVGPVDHIEVLAEFAELEIGEWDALEQISKVGQTGLVVHREDELQLDPIDERGRVRLASECDVVDNHL